MNNLKVKELKEALDHMFLTDETVVIVKDIEGNFYTVDKAMLYQNEFVLFLDKKIS
jgi:hypothetical protein